MAMGERIAELRKERKVSQLALADILDVSQSLIGLYETNQRTPSLENLEKLSGYFNVSIDYLVGRDATKPEKQIQIEGVYLRLAREAQDMGLNEIDVDFIIDFYKKHQTKNK